jgi:hypothetical protein
MVSVKDYGEAGDIWQACLTECYQESNVGTHAMIIPDTCATGDGGLFEYSLPAIASAPTGELCLAVRNIDPVDIWPAHMWLRIEVQCGGTGVDAAVDAVIQAVLFGQTGNKQLYVLPRTLAPGETVTGWNGEPLHVPGQEEYYVFIDLDPGANFEHPVQHAFVSASNGMITQVVDSTTPPRVLFDEMEPVGATNTVGRAADIDTVVPASYAADPPAGYPEVEPPPSTVPDPQSENDPGEDANKIVPLALILPPAYQLLVDYGGSLVTTAATTLGGFLPVYLDVTTPGTVWLYEYYHSTGTWNVQPFTVWTTGSHKLWFYGDVSGWHSIIAYVGGAWTNWIHINVAGGGPPPSTGCVVSPTSMTIGPVPPGSSASQTFTITNNTSSFKAGSVIETCPEFSVSPQLYFIPPFSSTTVTVTFSPTNAGTETCLINVGGSSCSNVTVTGTTSAGPPPAGCSVSPTFLSFGTVQQGLSATQTFTISNTGGSWLSGTISESCFEFSVSQTSFTIPPYSSTSITVTFAPTSQGTKNCTINLSGGCASVACGGVGGPPPGPSCSVSPTYLNFGTVSQWSSATQTFTISNTSASSWLSGSISESCPEFSVSAPSFSIPPLGSTSITVTFSPTSPGGKSCTISLGGGCSSVSCAGTVLPPSGQKYALLLSGGVSAGSNYPRYLNDLTEIYWTLRNQLGFSASNIFVLYANGSGPSWVTNSATRANLFSTFATLQGLMGSSDELMVFVTNHGGQTVSGTNQAKIWLWNYESIADWEFANQVNLLNSGAKKYFVFGQCYSGGMVDNLAGPNRHIATASAFNEVSYACDGINDQGNCGSFNYDEFVMHWTAAFKGSYPNAWPLLSNPDTNSDTVVSLDEAFFYARNWDTRSETPQRSDVGGIGGGGL